jgi:Flp pilus assembly protein TadG
MRQRRGASTVELAMIVPVLIVVVGGCVDLARFAYADIALSNAVRAGAAWTMINPPSNMTTPATSWQTSVQTAVSNEMSLQTEFVVGQLTVSGGSSNVKLAPSQSQGNLVYLVE